MKRTQVLSRLKNAAEPVQVHRLCREFGATAEAVYATLVQLEALALARPVIGEVSPSRHKCIGWVARSGL